MCRSQISGSTKDQFTSENEVCEITQTHKKGMRNHFAAKGWFRSAAKLAFSLRCSVSNGCNSSFQLRIVHHWIDDFLSFKTTYSMHKSDFSKCSKSSWHDCHKKCFTADFSLLPLLAFRICLWQRTSKLWFFMFLNFPLLYHGFQVTLLNLGLLWWLKSYQNTKT